jgi:hypothetical protein
MKTDSALGELLSLRPLHSGLRTQGRGLARHQLLKPGELFSCHISVPRDSERVRNVNQMNVTATMRFTMCCCLRLYVCSVAVARGASVASAWRWRAPAERSRGRCCREAGCGSGS